MCNIAGYIGKKQAAPVLAEMMKRQEGFAGGYYTGIVTHDGKKLHSDKVIGDMENLLNETDCLNFPGTMGFLHSRSKSGGDREWGHPFMTEKGDLAYIANGYAGVFLDETLKQKRSKLAAELEEKGYAFKSKVRGVIGNYPVLPDGTAVHMSDLMCQYVAYLIDSGMSPADAMSRAHSEIPCEAVGLIIREANPESIFVTRINFPMMIGITDDGDTYLATTALAFPENVSFKLIELLPPASTFEVFKGGYKMSAAEVKVGNVAPITPDIWHRAYKYIEELLSGRANDPMLVGEIRNSCRDLWQKGKVGQGDPLVYEILRAFKKEGRLAVSCVHAEGAFEGYKTNEFKVYLKE